MTHVVTERCVDCRYTDCCAVCPADCFLEVKEPAMLVIDPETCIDCGLCIPECPIYAIYPLAEVPEHYKEWIQKNADLAASGKGETINEKIDALPGAIPLDEIHAREKSKGWPVKDPSAVSEGGGGDEAAPAPAPAPAASAPPPPAAPAPPADSAPTRDRSTRVQVPRAPERPPLDVRVGGRVRLGHREATVLEMRQRRGGGYYDVKLQLDGDVRPTWHIYSALQTRRDNGDLEILDPGPPTSLLSRLFGM